MKKISLFCAAAIAASSPIQAQEVEAQERSQAAETRLSLAREIIDTSYPEDAREPMFRAVGEQIEAQVLQSLQGQLDSGALEIIKNWQSELKNQTNAILSRNIPVLMDAWAKAYADIFTEKELREILGFVSTETGKTFMLKSTDVVTHPYFTEANQVFMDETMTVTMEAMPSLIQQIVAYKEAQEHTD